MKPMLATEYAGQNICGWLMSEKLDGVRAIWDGAQLVSRNGNRFSPPAWFTASLPPGVVLDGELFAGRGKLQAVCAIVKKKTPVDAEWRQLTFHVFDAPRRPGGFAERLAFCCEILKGNTVAKAVPHRECGGDEDAESFCDSVLAAGGEGIVLRSPRSRYKGGRSPRMLKHKRFDSAEAEFLRAGEKSLLLRWKNSVFSLRAPRDVIAAMPAPGVLVTFSFCGITASGAPRCAGFQAVRDYE